MSRAGVGELRGGRSVHDGNPRDGAEGGEETEPEVTVSEGGFEFGPGKRDPDNSKRRMEDCPGRQRSPLKAMPCRWSGTCTMSK